METTRLTAKKHAKLTTVKLLRRIFFLTLGAALVSVGTGNFPRSQLYHRRWGCRIPIISSYFVRRTALGCTCCC